MMVIALVAVPLSVGAVAANASATDDGAHSEGPTVETSWWDTVNDTAVIAAANLTDAGNHDVADVRIEYRENGLDDEWRSSESAPAQAPEETAIDLIDLVPGTEYEYRAVAETATGTDRGDVRTFETPRHRPGGNTVPPVDVDETSATLATNVTALGGELDAQIWFSYEPAHSDAWHSEWMETPSQTVTGTGIATQTVEDLDPETAYEYTAHVSTGGEYGYSTGYETFTTDAAFDVETRDVRDATTSTATLTGEIVDFGGADRASASFEFRPPNADEWAETPAVDSDSPGGVEAAVDGLDPGTEYVYRIVGEASDGDADVGETATFETASDPVVDTVGASTVDHESATLAGDVGDLGGGADGTVSVEYRPTDGGTWLETDGETVADTGPFEVAVDELEADTAYEYRAVVRVDGVTATGDVRSFETDVAEREPTIETLSGSEDSPPNPHAELAVDWRVADADGDLDAVTVTIRDARGTVVDRSDGSIGGASAGGSIADRVKHGAGETYTVTVDVVDEAGNAATRRVDVVA